ncbi:MAG: LysE family translocator [Alphaproteobacteria bacterium]|nr:LysE family translocator [Alphaproteobacteria bacterium]
MPIETADLLVFVSAALMLNLTPGNDMMFVLGQSLRGGVRQGLAASLGIATGSFIHLILVALGVAVVLARHPVLLDAIRYAGAAYLVWIAVQTLRHGAVTYRLAGSRGSALTAWREGTLVNVLNPKIIVFFFAFLPPFIRPEHGSPLLQLLILGLLFNIGGTLINFAVSIFASRTAYVLSINARISRAFSIVSATLFLVLAARMILDRR